MERSKQYSTGGNRQPLRHCQLFRGQGAVRFSTTCLKRAPETMGTRRQENYSRASYKQSKTGNKAVIINLPLSIGVGVKKNCWETGRNSLNSITCFKLLLSLAFSHTVHMIPSCFRNRVRRTEDGGERKQKWMIPLYPQKERPWGSRCNSSPCLVSLPLPTSIRRLLFQNKVQDIGVTRFPGEERCSINRTWLTTKTSVPGRKRETFLVPLPHPRTWESLLGTGQSRSLQKAKQIWRWGG